MAAINCNIFAWVFRCIYFDLRRLHDFLQTICHFYLVNFTSFLVNILVKANQSFQIRRNNRMASAINIDNIEFARFYPLGMQLRPMLAPYVRRNKKYAFNTWCTGNGWKPYANEFCRAKLRGLEPTVARNRYPLHTRSVYCQARRWNSQSRQQACFP